MKTVRMLSTASLRKGRTIPQALTPGRRRELIAHVQATHATKRETELRGARRRPFVDPVSLDPRGAGAAAVAHP